MGGYWRTACAFITRPTEILWGDPTAVGNSGRMLKPTGQQRSLACFIRASIRHVELDTIPSHTQLPLRVHDMGDS
jgi:hypothetical protein